MSRYTPLYICLFTLLIAGCGSSPAQKTPTIKTLLSIQTRAIQDLSGQSYLTKTARMVGKSSIVLAAQTAGKVASISPKIGDLVNQGGLIVALSDTAGMATFGVKRADISMQQAQIGNTIQQKNLIKQRDDVGLNHEKSTLVTETTIQDIKKQLEKIDYDLANVDGSLSGSTTALTLAKLQKELTKAQFDVKTKTKADGQTSENFLLSAKNIYTDLSTLLTDTINETDKMLFISDLYKFADDGSTIYIGAKDNASQSKVITSFWELKKIQKTLSDYPSTSMTQDNIKDYLATYQSLITQTNNHYVLMKIMLTNSIETATNIPVLAGKSSLFNGLQSKASGLSSSIAGQLNGINSFYATVNEGQESLNKQIDLLRDQIALTKKSLDDAAYNTTLASARQRLALELQTQQTRLNQQSSQNLYDFTTSTFDLSADNANLSLAQADIARQQSLFDRNKLSISSPILGYIEEILVDIGQDVSPGTPVAHLISRDQEVTLSLTQSEVTMMKIGQTISLYKDEQIVGSGIVSQIAQTADKAGNLSVIIRVTNADIPTGSYIQVRLPIISTNTMIPLSIVHIVDTNQGVIYLRDGITIISQTIDIVGIYGDLVQTNTPLDASYKLIMSDVSQINPDEVRIEVR